jgi:hypothetical protein
MIEPQAFWDTERSMPSMPITESDMRDWEKMHGLSLPPSLATVLLVQNGGGVSGTEIFIEPLASITPLTE